MHKTYFTASLRGVQYYLHNYQEIYKHLAELGCEHLDKEILTLNKSKYYSSLERKGSKEFHKLYEKKELEYKMLVCACLKYLSRAQHRFPGPKGTRLP